MICNMWLISVHSYRRGTGKSLVAANLAVLLAQAGYRVGLVELNLLMPSLYYFFELAERDPPYLLNDFLWGDCDITAVTQDMTATLQIEPPGQLYLLPASVEVKAIARIARGGYYTHFLADACFHLADTFGLDMVLADTPAGINEESQLMLALADNALILLRPDRQDYQGTGLLVDIARRLEVPDIQLVVNEVPAALNVDSVALAASQAYGCRVTAVLPHSPTISHLAGQGLFVIRQPQHAITHSLWALTEPYIISDC
jgi:septum site-determining protein MinD